MIDQATNEIMFPFKGVGTGWIFRWQNKCESLFSLIHSPPASTIHLNQGILSPFPSLPISLFPPSVLTPFPPPYPIPLPPLLYGWLNRHDRGILIPWEIKHLRCQWWTVWTSCCIYQPVNSIQRLSVARDNEAAPAPLFFLPPE